MSTIPAPRRRPEPPLPTLENGDRMNQPEFHRRYSAYPGETKFELIGGIVHMASPQRRTHCRFEDTLGLALNFYELGTPGVETLRTTTTILGEESEPQPDLMLRILPEFKGQSQTTSKDYVQGPPEWIGEIAHSTRSIDMHRKRDDYRAAGVKEYVVVCIEDEELHWFDFKGRRMLRPTEGVYRSRVFPGLWIDGAALFKLDAKRVLEVLQQGLESAEHAAFAQRLAEAR